MIQPLLYETPTLIRAAFLCVHEPHCPAGTGRHEAIVTGTEDRPGCVNTFVQCSSCRREGVLSTRKA